MTHPRPPPALQRFVDAIERDPSAFVQAFGQLVTDLDADAMRPVVVQNWTLVLDLPSGDRLDELERRLGDLGELGIDLAPRVGRPSGRLVVTSWSTDLFRPEPARLGHLLDRGLRTLDVLRSSRG